MSNIKTAQSSIIIRQASSDDIPQLLEIEQACFATDRLSPRSFKRFIQEARCDIYVCSGDSTLWGYYLLLYRQGTSLARLYSIAVHPAQRGKGLAALLLTDAEQKASARHCALLRLEVRQDNPAAINLYQTRGYLPFGIKADFYEDHTSAICMQKQIQHFSMLGQQRLVPYIAQSTPFTCGPASLLMVFNYFEPGRYLPEQLEIDIWREATTIFMTSGHGGCGPRGLALAAYNRGYEACLYLNQEGPLFLDTVRSEAKKLVLQRVYQSDQAKIQAAGIALTITEPDLALVKKLLQQGYILLVLISTWQFDRSKAPHWVVVCAIDDYFVYINDPDIADIPWLANHERQYIPISHRVFTQAFAYGKVRLKAIVAIKKPITT